jgi:hypothetical protein
MCKKLGYIYATFSHYLWAWTKMKISELKGSFSESVRVSAYFNEQEVLISGGRKAKKTHTLSRRATSWKYILHTGRAAEFRP